MDKKQFFMALMVSSLSLAAHAQGFCPDAGDDEARAAAAARVAGEFIDVGLYDGSKGISHDVLRAIEDSVVRINTAGGGACTGVLLPGNRVLTAAHCWPGGASSSVTGQTVVFNDELDENGNLRTTRAFPVTGIREWRTGGAAYDYAVIDVGGNPSQFFPFARLSNRIPAIGENLVSVNHSGGLRKTVESGPMLIHKSPDVGSWVETVELYVEAGGSGGSIVDGSGFAVSLGLASLCTGDGFTQGGHSIRRLSALSPTIGALLTRYRNEERDYYHNTLNTAIEWANVGSFNWQLNTGSTPTDQTGPSSGSYAYFRASQASRLGDTAALVSHPFTSKGKIIRFDYHMFGADIGQLSLELLDQNSTWTRLWSVSGQQQSSSSSSWKSATVRLDGFSTGTARVRFVATAKGGSRGDIAIDNILIENEVPVSGAKVCEFGVPTVGATPGCSERNLWSSGLTQSFEVKKNGAVLLNFTKTGSSSGACTISGSNSSYRVAGGCTNYQVYKR